MSDDDYFGLDEVEQLYLSALEGGNGRGAKWLNESRRAYALTRAMHLTRTVLHRDTTDLVCLAGDIETYLRVGRTVPHLTLIPTPPTPPES